jgi:hypothetical protein
MYNINPLAGAVPISILSGAFFWIQPAPIDAMLPALSPRLQKPSFRAEPRNPESASHTDPLPRTQVLSARPIQVMGEGARDCSVQDRNSGRKELRAQK